MMQFKGRCIRLPAASAERRRQGAAGAVLAILLALCLSGCGDIYRYLKSGEVGWALKKELRDRRATRVDLVKITKFGWDELFLFGPYEPSSEVCKRLALAPGDCESAITDESTDDGDMLMVFRQAGKVVHSEMHVRWHGDFTPVPDDPLTPETAAFTVSVDGKGASGEDWLKLSLISAVAPSFHSTGATRKAAQPIAFKR